MILSSKTFTPRPYQNLIINHEINTLRCNIWAGMGKTVATLTTLEDLFMAVVFCPPSPRSSHSTAAPQSAPLSPQDTAPVYRRGPGGAIYRGD